MAIESFFSIQSSLKALKTLFQEDLVSFDNRYDEFTLKYKGYYLWLYVYNDDEKDISEEEITNLNINIKYESQTPIEVITDFKDKLLNIGFVENIF